MTGRKTRTPPAFSIDNALPRLDNFDYEQTSTIQTETNQIEPASSRWSARPTLTVVAGADAGRVVAVESDLTYIGRATSCALVLPDPGVSRRHACLRRTDTSFVIEDLGSKNGVFVHGERIRSRVLSEGDAFEIGPNVVLRLARMSDVEERLARQLYESSMRDVLTQAFNRRYFVERLHGETAFARRHREPLSVIVIDFDHFKRVNDTYGHKAGDDALRQGARRIMVSLRSEDVFARTGGEEFAVLLRGIPHHQAIACAERVRDAIAYRPLTLSGHDVTISVSIGVASLDDCPDDDDVADALVEIADKRLYEAKRAGRDRVCGRRT